MPVRVGRHWCLTRKLGSGSFGDIYLGVHFVTGAEVAIKLEPLRRRTPHLLYEYKLYRMLEGGIGIPKIFWFGVEGEFSALVMELLGPSLEDLFEFCGRRFSLRTAVVLADQLLSRIEFVHSRGIVHRDIKPHNFLLGRGANDRLVYAIDFGLAKRFRNPTTLEHIPYREGKNLTGTARFVSANVHLGCEQSRRDDLESLGYVLFYFLRGSLPWQGLRAVSKCDKYQKIMECKLNTSVAALSAGCPTEFSVFMSYCQSLGFWERPDYSYCRELFLSLAKAMDFKSPEESLDPLVMGSSALATRTTAIFTTTTKSLATPRDPPLSPGGGAESRLMMVVDDSQEGEEEEDASVVVGKGGLEETQTRGERPAGCAEGSGHRFFDEDQCVERSKVTLV